MSRKPKGIGLISGGLDSILAFRVLQDQDVDLLGLLFKTPFFGPAGDTDYEMLVGAPVEVVDITERHLQMMRNPVYGFGSQMNPCIDCHALMLREAGRRMQDPARDFLFTGEVLGQRPMSQRRDSLKSVEKLSGYPGRVLRPLSARLLTPTVMEVEGLIDRTKLLDIQGRSRKRQEALAKRYGITEYPQPGGGCMLTKEGFARRLRRLLELYPAVAGHQVELLKWGRTFDLPTGKICVIGRDRHDNAALESTAGSGETVLRTVDHPGPTGVLLSPSHDAESLTATAQILAAYSDAPAGIDVAVAWHSSDGSGVSRVETFTKESFRHLLIG
ncbi:MAG: tRNA 4-thiouridine(8) synthase ThiI [Syntrophobacteraceae bacterium]